MKTAVSVPDDLCEDGERLAQMLKKSRSRLYSDARREYVARHAPERVTEALAEVCAKIGSTGEAGGEEFARAAARGVLETSEW